MTIKRKNTRIHTRKTINNRSIGGKKKSRRRKPKRHRGRKAGGAALVENITTLDDIRVRDIVDDDSAIEVISNFNNLFGGYLRPGTTASLDDQRYAAQKYIDITNASKHFLESNENERRANLWAVMKERSKDLKNQVESINKRIYLRSRPEAVSDTVSNAEMQSRLVRNILALGVARSTSKKKGKKKKKKKKRRKKEII